jgi:hypothetical protein
MTNKQTIYYRGRSLAFDRRNDASVEEGAAAAYAAYKRGEVYLLQRVVDVRRDAAGYAVRQYEYLTVGRSK